MKYDKDGCWDLKNCTFKELRDSMAAEVLDGFVTEGGKGLKLALYSGMQATLQWSEAQRESPFTLMKKRAEKAETELKRYSMSAGQADQRRAESRAVREVLGFDPEGEDVAPVDLVEAITALGKKKRK